MGAAAQDALSRPPRPPGLRVTALREINGFAPHDADDMLITYCYRQAGYLRQQYRWARSVLDIKFRIQPRMDLRLPWHEWLICYLHGFY